MRQDLVNLSELARRIKMSMEAKTLETYSENAVYLSLKRYSKKLSKEDKVEIARLDSVSIIGRSNLLCLPNDDRGSSLVKKLINELDEKINLVMGDKEIVLASKSDALDIIERSGAEIVYFKKDLYGITCSYDVSLIREGSINQIIFSNLRSQDVAIVESISTATQTTVFVSKEDAEKAISSLQRMV